MSDTLHAAHPALRDLAALLDDGRRELLAVWSSIPPADRERRPAPDAWTPAEVMDHLRIVEGGSARLLARRLQRAQEAGLGPESNPASRVGGMTAYDLPNSPVRLEAPEAVRPAPGASGADAEAGLVATRATLRDLLATADGLALGEVRAQHMRFGDLDMYQWLEFIALHERRHARQLERLRDALAGTTTIGATTAAA